MAEAYSGIAGGWVRERFLRQRRYIPQLTVNAESANAIAVDISLTTYQEDNNEYVTADESIDLEVLLVGADGAQAATTAYTMAETGDGTEVTASGLTRMIISTSTSGAAQVTVTDVVGTSTETLYMFVRPLNVPGFPAYTSLTFA